MHKLLPRLSAFPKHTRHTARRSRSGGLPNASHNHTQMRAFHNDRNALRPQDLLDGDSDLPRQPLLQLQTARKHLCDAGKLGEAEDAPVGDVANVHFARERDEVVLAHGEDLDVLDDDELVVVFGEDGVVDDRLQVFLVAFGEVEHGFCVARWRVEEALAVGVFTDAFEDRTDAAGRLVDWLVGGRRVDC